jgi:hypothetical protein
MVFFDIEHLIPKSMDHAKTYLGPHRNLTRNCPIPAQDPIMTFPELDRDLPRT